MSLTLREFIASRRAEIKQQLASLRAELKELDAAEQGIGKTTIKGADPLPAATKSFTLKQMAVATLREFPEGLEATKIAQQIHQKFGIEVPRTSLSPQLSRLGDDKKVERHGLIWKLTSPPSSTEPTNDNPVDEEPAADEQISSLDGSDPSKELSFLD